MKLAVSVIFISLCISAPSIARKWGWRGNLVPGIASLAFIISTILLLE